MKYSAAYLMLTVASLIVINPTAALALDYYVDGTTGSDSNSGLSPAHAWKTITHALEGVAATEENPAVISIAAGVYAASTNGESFPIMISQDYISLYGRGAGSTYLDGESQHGIFCIEYLSAVSIQDCCIRGAPTGGISIEFLPYITTRAVQPLRLVRCALSNNRGRWLVRKSGYVQMKTGVSIDGCWIAHNDTSVGLVDAYNVEVRSSLIEKNESEQYLLAFVDDVLIRETVVQDNHADMIFFGRGGSVTFQECLFRRNQGDELVSGYSHFVLVGCAVWDNQMAGSLLQTEGASFVLEQSSVCRNSARELMLLVLIWGVGALRSEGCLMASNKIGRGALIGTVSEGLTASCPFPASAAAPDRMRPPRPRSQSSAPAGDAGATEGSFPLAEIVSCTISDNHPPRRKIPTVTRPASARGIVGNPIITRDCIFGSNGVTLARDVDWGYLWPSDGTYCCVESEFDGEGNFVADPLFASGPLGDYYLSSTAAGQDADSPCIDAGSTSASAAGVGNLTTRTDGAFDTGIVDIGYHYSATPPTIDCEVSGGSDALIVTLDAQPFAPGDTLSASIRIGNGGLPLWVDIYAGFILPDGSIYCISADGLTTDLVPWAAAAHLPSDFNSGDVVVFEAPTPGGLPEGAYTFAAALSITGGFRPTGDIAFSQFTVGS